MSRQYVLNQTILVPSSVRTKRAFELWIDAALEIVMPLQMMFVFVRFAAGSAGMLEHRNHRILALH